MQELYEDIRKDAEKQGYSIPDAKCNGDMHAALDYAQKVKHEQKDFLNSQALHQLY